MSHTSSEVLERPLLFRDKAKLKQVDPSVNMLSTAKTNPRWR
jgi:hypothetical protein